MREDKRIVRCQPARFADGLQRAIGVPNGKTDTGVLRMCKCVPSVQAQCPLQLLLGRFPVLKRSVGGAGQIRYVGVMWRNPDCFRQGLQCLGGHAQFHETGSQSPPGERFFRVISHERTGVFLGGMEIPVAPSMLVSLPGAREAAVGWGFD
nr:hypothetical protein [Alloalcanivorax profundimaris]